MKKILSQILAASIILSTIPVKASNTRESKSNIYEELLDNQIIVNNIEETEFDIPDYQPIIYEE